MIFALACIYLFLMLVFPNRLTRIKTIITAALMSANAAQHHWVFATLWGVCTLLGVYVVWAKRNIA